MASKRCRRDLWGKEVKSVTNKLPGKTPLSTPAEREEGLKAAVVQCVILSLRCALKSRVVSSDSWDLIEYVCFFSHCASQLPVETIKSF